MSRRASNQQALGRWRLVLGRYAHEALGADLGARAQRMDRALEYIYGREYAGRGVRPSSGQIGLGSLDPSQLSVPDCSTRCASCFPGTPPKQWKSTHWTAMA
jgi:hypothetical protein